MVLHALLTSWLPPALASEAEVVRRHRFLPVPVIKVEPGAGFTTGVRGRYVYREPEDRLNRINLDVVSRVSVRRVQQHDIRLRMRDLWHRDEVVDVNFRFDDDPVFTYVGIANEDRLDNAAIVDETFEAHRFSISPDVNVQFVLARKARPAEMGPTAFLRGFVGWTWSLDRFTAEPGTQFAQDQPQPTGTTKRGTWYGGVAWDSRDNDWHPTRGGFHDVSVAAGGPWALGDTYWSRFNASFRHYAPLGSKRLVLAQQVLAEFQGGNVPLIPLGEFSGLVFRDGVGGVDIGRGFFRRRFIGRRKAAGSTELRIQAGRFNLGPFTFEPGIKPFIDAAWVQDTPAPLPSGLHLSGGAGIYVVWDDFEVIRADLAVSPEGMVFLLAADHAF
ncbi:MAG: BamA/TamA family outer membrane protein [Myxococcota bacterium]